LPEPWLDTFPGGRNGLSEKLRDLIDVYLHPMS